ncbi:hypothetical protein BD770DRAFT_412389 [Pilaira anomala]|nr:hypothetical protein BD770DRAFT_412389 [Pilaira anomala]
MKIHIFTSCLPQFLKHTPVFLFFFGETSLKAKSVEVNRYLFDDDRRFAGPKIDLIVRDNKYDMEIMIIEVSGPPSKVNQTHYIEDRNKTCKNPKTIKNRSPFIKVWSFTKSTDSQSLSGVSSCGPVGTGRHFSCLVRTNYRRKKSKSNVQAHCLKNGSTVRNDDQKAKVVWLTILRG